MNTNTSDSSTVSIDSRTIVVCGSGNASHACVGEFSSNGFTVDVFVPFQNEAERWNATIARTGIDLIIDNPDGSQIIGHPRNVSKHPADIIPGADIIVLPLPDFSLEPVLTAMKDYLRPGAIIMATPGGVVEWIARKALGSTFDQICLAVVQPLPYNCRVIEFGRRVNVIGKKNEYKIACYPRDRTDEVGECVTAMWNATSITKMKYFLSLTLYNANSIIHPQRLYGLLHKYKEGNTLHGNPLFYEDMDDFSANLIEQCDGELQNSIRMIEEQCDLDGLSHECPPQPDRIKKTYPNTIADMSSFRSCFATNAAYKGIRCPFLQQNDGTFVPDFTSRYFTEDIPGGSCMMKGVNELCGLETPTIDKVVTFFQTFLGKEYIVNGALNGKNAAETKAPHNYGFTTLKKLCATAK
ncbi:MAG TPA: hypothetical protein EYO39_07260 [Nitrospirales bacterium]|nr:hypothetical protein [Nitrospirales bacterium]